GEMPAADLCGNCRQCLDACPTEALTQPYVLDARRCISYLTIELRGVIPEEFREAIGRNVYGCDICQDVCPFNRSAPAGALANFEPRRVSTEKSLFEPSLAWLAEMNEEEFRQVFRGSAIKRTKWKGMVRNACIALGNAPVATGKGEYRKAVSVLRRLAASEDEGIKMSAEWALSRIQKEATDSR
ncbi:MAG TPA: 4Fe-4S double cluster binding domain-containing protein, partial [Methylomirabilota bacterium]|nr:4Fe-4S double cluster binding domain-containing protein [Methylomirabilota bacterium]